MDFITLHPYGATVITGPSYGDVRKYLGVTNRISLIRVTRWKAMKRPDASPSWRGVPGSTVRTIGVINYAK